MNGSIGRLACFFVSKKQNKQWPCDKVSSNLIHKRKAEKLPNCTVNLEENPENFHIHMSNNGTV